MATINSEIEALKRSACYAQLAPIATEYEKSDIADAKVVQLKDLILDASKKEGYAHYIKMHVKHVGGTPDNRGGEGLSWQRAHSRVSKIKSSGFSSHGL